MSKIAHLKLTQSYEEKFKEIHAKSLKEVQNTPEYKQNLMQIDSITNVLINNADVPEKLICWLIDAVRSNTELEYTVTNKKIFKYLKNNQMT